MNETAFNSGLWPFSYSDEKALLDIIMQIAS